MSEQHVNLTPEQLALAAFDLHLEIKREVAQWLRDNPDEWRGEDELYRSLRAEMVEEYRRQCAEAEQPPSLLCQRPAQA
jgi:hypothetical protein